MAASIKKRLVFTLVAVVGGLGLIEGGCYLVELSLVDQQATMPAPVPGGCPAPCLEGQVSELPRDQSAGAIKMSNRGRGQRWGFAPYSVVKQGNIAAQMNSLGFRGPEPRDKAADERRILVLGDSSVFGYGVEDGATFHELGAAALGEALERPVVSINGAIPGYSTLESITVMEEMGPTIGADVVLIASIWSDLYHEDAVQSWEKPGGSATYRVLTRALAPWLKARTVGWLDPENDAGTPGMGRSPRSSLREYRDNLGTLVELSLEVGAVPVFFRLPAPMDLDPNGVPPWIADYRHVQGLVAHENGLVVIDGPSYMAAHDHDLVDYYDHVHPSAVGHAKLGAAMAEGLEPVLRDID